MFGVPSKKESDAKKRLVLGFDAGCCTCSEIARRVEERVGDRLEVISLRDPRVQEWCERALGEMLLGLQPSSRSEILKFGHGLAGGWEPN